MTVPLLEDALVEFIKGNTSELKMRSNEQSRGEIEPRVYSAFIPRNEVGEIIPGEIGTYPAIIVRARQGTCGRLDETVTVEILIGTFDDNKDQQGSRDTLNLVQRIKDRIIQQSLIGQRFRYADLMNWQINKRMSASGGKGEYNAYPYYFAEMQIDFKLAIPAKQYEATMMTGDRADEPFDTPAPEFPEFSFKTAGYGGETL